MNRALSALDSFCVRRLDLGARLCRRSGRRQAARLPRNPQQRPRRSTAGRQAAAPKPAEPAREIPPEQKAYQEAVKIGDPDKKIEALKKVIADFPKTSVRRDGRGPDPHDAREEGRRHDQGRPGAGQEDVGRRRPARPRGQRQHRQQLPRREPAAGRSRDLRTKAVGVTAANRQVRRRAEEVVCRTPGRGAEEGPDREADDAARRCGHGRTASRPCGRWRSSRWRRSTTSAARPRRPRRPSRTRTRWRRRAVRAYTAALRLAEFAKKAGRDVRAVRVPDGRRPRRASDRRLTARRSKSLYKKTHNGSLDGLEEMLDARYAKENPPLVHVTPYVPHQGPHETCRAGRGLHGAGCPPCAGADLAYDGAMERYGHTELAVLMYHMHIPRPDPMANPYTHQARGLLRHPWRADGRRGRRSEGGRRQRGLSAEDLRRDGRAGHRETADQGAGYEARPEGSRRRAKRQHATVVGGQDRRRLPRSSGCTSCSPRRRSATAARTACGTTRWSCATSPWATRTRRDSP